MYIYIHTYVLCVCTHIDRQDEDAALGKEAIGALEHFEVMSLRVDFCKEYVLVCWHLCIRPLATSVSGLKLLAYEALSY